MRVILLIGAFAVLMSPRPAAADVTARYVSPMNPAVAMTVQVNDRGDSRASMGNQMAILTVGGVTYHLTADLAGTFAVRQDDMMAVFAEQARSLLGDRPSNPAAGPAPAYDVIERGTETVAGRTGRVFALRRRGADAETGIDFVISNDPDLAGIGLVLERQMSASSAGMTSAFGGQNPGAGFAGAIESIFRRGTMIRSGRLMRLDSVTHDPIPAEAFALPATILTRDQYAARAGLTPRN